MYINVSRWPWYWHIMWFLMREETGVRRKLTCMSWWPSYNIRYFPVQADNFYTLSHTPLSKLATKIPSHNVPAKARWQPPYNITYFTVQADHYNTISDTSLFKLTTTIQSQILPCPIYHHNTVSHTSLSNLMVELGSHGWEAR